MASFHRIRWTTCSGFGGRLRPDYANNNILEYVLSKRVILVEGDAEFILMDLFFFKLTGKTLEELNIHVISVGGTSFKRFLDIAVLLDIRTAVIRDNDTDYETHCVNNFSEYSTNPHNKIFFDTDNTRSTFEIALYQDVFCKIKTDHPG